MNERVGCPHESQNSFKTLKIFLFFTKSTIIYPIYPNNAAEKDVIHMKHIRKTLKHPKKYLYSHEQRTQSNIKALKNLHRNSFKFIRIYPLLSVVSHPVPTLSPMWIRVHGSEKVLAWVRSWESHHNPDMDSDSDRKLRSAFHQLRFEIRKNVNGIFYDWKSGTEKSWSQITSSHGSGIEELTRL